jgi:ankyrin repeat protein
MSLGTISSVSPSESKGLTSATLEETQSIAADAAQTPKPIFDDVALLALRRNDKLTFIKLLDERAGLHSAVDPHQGATPAHWAAYEGYVSILEELFARDGRMDGRANNTGMTPLHWACNQGHLQVAMFLVEVAGCSADSCDGTGATPLMLAAQHNWPRLVFWLNQRAPDTLRAVDRDGDTALHWASYKGSLACVTLLCEFGLTPLTQDKHGANALHLAVGRNQEPTVRWLLQHAQSDAMLAALDNKGRTPLMIAEEKGLEMMHWLCTEGRLDKRAVPVQLLHRNAFTAYANANHFISRVSCEGMSKAIQLREKMYGGATPRSVEMTPRAPSSDAREPGGATPEGGAAPEGGATPAPTQAAAPVQPAAEEEAEATGAPAAPKPADSE